MADFKNESDILAYLKKCTCVVAVYLFGSRAQDACRTDSDYDVAVLTRAESRPSAATVFGWKTDLEKRLKASVDLILLNTASPIVVHQILKTGRLLWRVDRGFLARFTMRAQAEYADLKILRRPAEAAILKRKIYG